MLVGADRKDLYLREARLASQRLEARAGRDPQHEIESAALGALLPALAAPPVASLELVANAALHLCHGHSAGITLPAGFPSSLSNVSAGAADWHIHACAEQDASPWGLARNHNETLLFRKPGRSFGCLETLTMPVEEVLIAPVATSAGSPGTLWVISHDESTRFDAEDGRLLRRLSHLAAAMIHRGMLSEQLASSTKAAEALHRSEERLRLAMEATQFGTFEWDIDSDEVKCSPNVKRLLNFSCGAGMKLEDVLTRVHPEDRDAVRATIRVAMDASGPRTYVGEFRTVPVDGRIRWLDARGAVLFRQLGQRPQCMVGILVDASERKHHEQELQETAQDLGKANRAKDEFMATLAHELRNPLTPIRNGIEILQLTGLAHPSQQRACTVMGRQLRHLVHLVDDLLDVTRITQRRVSLKREVVSVRSVVDYAVETILPQIDAAQHSLNVQIPSEPVLLEADPVRMSQAIGNLLSNSARYTPAGGQISLTAQPMGDEVEISVRDNGVGISPELLPHVFDMFTRGTDPPHRSDAGLGIGLALTRALVEMHGGRIEAHSAGAGLGSEFRLWLPILSRHSDAPEDRTPHESANSHVTDRRRVLIVDDDTDGADSTAALLGMLGHEVHEARDGESAVHATQAFAPDLILMDIGMPGMDGHEAARRIRQLPLARQPVIVALTGWGNERERRRSREAGIDAHRLKPIDMDSLRQILAELGTHSVDQEVI